jgi:hypothetical protein
LDYTEITERRGRTRRDFWRIFLLHGGHREEKEVTEGSLEDFLLHGGHGGRREVAETFGFGLFYEAAEAVDEDGGVEVKEEADAAVGEFEIGEDLGVVDFREGVHGFDFDDDVLPNEEVGAVGVFDDDVLVADGAVFLLLKRDAAEGEFVREGALVSGFEKTGAKLLVNLDGGADDGSRESVFVFVHGRMLRVLRKLFVPSV